jgi:hypothetical protein
MLAAVTGAACAGNPQIREITLRWTLRAFLYAGIAGITLLVLKNAGLILPHLPHILRVEQVYFVAAWIWICRRWPALVLRLFMAGVFFWISAASGKATMSLLAVVFLVMTVGLDRIETLRAAYLSRRIDRGLYRLSLGGLALCVLAAANFVTYLVIDERIARYENDLRTEMWLDRWQQFLDSPVWGKVFYDSPLYVSPLLPDLALSTHNDFLDLLAFGGLLAFGVIALLLTRVLLSPATWIPLLRRGRALGPDAILPALLVCYLVAALGNPFFSIPRLAVPIWFAIGFLVVSAGHRTSPARTRPFSSAEAIS